MSDVARASACRDEIRLGLSASQRRRERRRCRLKPAPHRERGFTLIEVLVATAIMSIAVAGVLGGLSTASRNAARLTQLDRASLLAREKMDEILVDPSIPRKLPLQGIFDWSVAGGTTAGWRAQVLPFEVAPGAGPGQWVLDRVELEVWWMDGSTRRTFNLEAFRRGILRPGDL
jgi:general secretion pathway protein I